MPRHLQIESHLSLQELEKHYRQAKEGIKKAHYQVIWLLTQGKATSMVAEVTGYSLSWIYELVRSYNRYGASILGDQRRYNQGAEPLLNDQQQALRLACSARTARRWRIVEWAKSSTVDE